MATASTVPPIYANEPIYASGPLYMECDRVADFVQLVRTMPYQVTAARPSAVVGMTWTAICVPLGIPGVGAPLVSHVVVVFHSHNWTRPEHDPSVRAWRRVVPHKSPMEADMPDFLDEFFAHARDRGFPLPEPSHPTTRPRTNRMDALEFGDSQEGAGAAPDLRAAALLSLRLLLPVQYHFPDDTDLPTGWKYLAAVRLLLADALGIDPPRYAHAQPYDDFSREDLAPLIEQARRTLDAVS